MRTDVFAFAGLWLEWYWRWLTMPVVRRCNSYREWMAWPARLFRLRRKLRVLTRDIAEIREINVAGNWLDP